MASTIHLLEKIGVAKCDTKENGQIIIIQQWRLLRGGNGGSASPNKIK
jgi:hypothetical protein